MPLMRHLCLYLGTVCAILTASCFAPPAGEEFSPAILEKRETLQQKLENFIPEADCNNPDAHREAAWLSYTAYAASGAIARLNAPVVPGWFNNMLVNAGLQDRGLCWHYQHDLYRELRRHPLRFFRIGCCVRDQNEGSEHNCIYVTGRDTPWPECVVLDPWIWNGHLKIMEEKNLDNDWEDLPDMTNRLAEIYPEGHCWPLAHWYMLKAKDGKYHPWYTPAARASAQYRRMARNMKKERPTGITRP